MMAEALALAEPAFHAHSRDCRSGGGHFEVVHAVEHARDRYFAKLALGLPADLCKRHALGAFTTRGGSCLPGPGSPVDGMG